MPILGDDDVPEMPRNVIDGGNHFVTARHGQLSAGAEIVLNVHNNEDVSIRYLEALAHLAASSS